MNSRATKGTSRDEATIVARLKKVLKQAGVVHDIKLK